MKVIVRVPASSANLGPGFDCLALALDLWNEVTFSLEGQDLTIENRGEGSSFLPSDQRSLVIQSFRTCCQKAGKPVPTGLKIVSQNRIPVGSGLGSSAAAILAGLAAANHLMGGPFSPAQVLDIANQVEGHPDNLTAALYGGLTAVTVSESNLLVHKYVIPPSMVVLVLPEFRLSTRAARAALPRQVPLKDAVFNLSRAVFVVEALRSGDLALLSRVMEDRLHQEQRFQLIPGALDAVKAARQAGAAAAALSGAGPGIIAFAYEDHSAIAASMQQAFQSAGLKSRVLMLESCTQGVWVEEA